MDLKEEILKEHSKKQALKIAGWIGNDKKRFSRLLDLFLHAEYRVVQRSAWIISHVTDKYPDIAIANLKLLVNRLYDNNIHVAVKRNVVRVLQKMDIPEHLQAKVMNKCIEYITDPKETVAVRCFSMTVLANLAKEYPEIKNEANEVINICMKNSTPGLRVRARNIQKELAEV